MSRRLCIILRSIYPSYILGYAELNEEVRADSETVRETLTDHDILEISIPVLAKPKVITAIVVQLTAQINPEYESCHIVLNTHGAAGASDLADEAVKRVVQSLSSLGIAVSQLSALQCNGMSALSSAEQREADPMKSVHAIARGKDASLSKLQKKLNHTSATMPQKFAICGFGSAYDPKVDRESVVEVLRGRGPSLQVNTIAQSSREINLAQIATSIVVVRDTPEGKRIKNLAYDRATNMLGVVLESMKNNIRTCLIKGTAQNPENLLLFKKLNDLALNQNKDRPLGDAILDGIYKCWAKENKIHSESRLAVFVSYCKCLSTSVPNVAAAAVPSLDSRIPGPMSLGIRTLGVFFQEKQAGKQGVEAQEFMPSGIVS